MEYIFWCSPWCPLGSLPQWSMHLGLVQLCRLWACFDMLIYFACIFFSGIPGVKQICRQVRSEYKLGRILLFEDISRCHDYSQGSRSALQKRCRFWHTWCLALLVAQGYVWSCSWQPKKGMLLGLELALDLNMVTYCKLPLLIMYIIYVYI